MSNSRKPPSVAFWVTVVAIVGVLAYPLSFEPACWISSYLDPSGDIVSLIYRPIVWYWAYDAAESLDRLIGWYVGLGTKDGFHVHYLAPPPGVDFF